MGKWGALLTNTAELQEKNTNQKPRKNNVVSFPFNPYVPGWMPKNIAEYQAYSESDNIYLCEYCLFNRGRCNRGAFLPGKWQRCKGYQFSGRYREVTL